MGAVRGVRLVGEDLVKSWSIQITHVISIITTHTTSKEGSTTIGELGLPKPCQDVRF